MDPITVHSRNHVAQADFSFVMNQILILVEADTSNCKVVYLSYLIRRARELLHPHSKGRSFCPQWDTLFAYVLVHCLSHCILPQAWERTIREIMTHDIEQIVPHDGSVGHVVHLFHTMKSVLDSVICNDKKSTMLLLQRSKSRLPVLHISDEFGWSLLHHAAFHSATDVMKALVFEGISPATLCHQGQTPIHVAAAALRYGAITTLLGLGALSSAATLAITDAHGRTPLQCLLHALSVGAWSRKLSSQQLLDFIKMLLARDIDLWNFTNYGGKSTYAPLTSFGCVVVHSDAYVAETILKRAFEALSVRRDDEQDVTFLEKHKEEIVFEVKRVILLIIRKKKSRVLASLLTTFGELLFENYKSLDANMHPSEQAAGVDNSKGSHDFDSNSGFFHLALPQPSAVRFLHQCLCGAVESDSLRVMSVLLKFGSLVCPNSEAEGELQGVTFEKTTQDMYRGAIALFNFRESGAEKKWFAAAETGVMTPKSSSLESCMCTSPFLLVPVLRGDSSMLRLILDHMDTDPVTLLWLSSPCMPHITSPKEIVVSETSRTGKMLPRSVEQFMAWCHMGKLRSAAKLLPLAHSIFSPIAAACLHNDPYLLKLMLAKHWCSKNMELPEDPPTNYLYRGINPLVCCLFSGSVACMKLLKEHFGDHHFENMCNCKDDLELLPLSSLMLFLRVKLKRRVFVSPEALPATPSCSFVESVMRYFSLFSPGHANLLEMFRILLSCVKFSDLQNWQDEDTITKNEKEVMVKIKDFDEMKTRLCQRVSEIDSIPPVDEVSVELTEGSAVECSRESCQIDKVKSNQQWEYLDNALGSDAFVNSLRTLSNIVCKAPEKNTIMRSGAYVDEIRLNRQFQNITRAVVLLLRRGEELNHFSTNWWSELDDLVNESFDKANYCKLARQMLAMKKSVFVEEDVLHRVQECVDHTEKWLAQGNSLLPARKSNCYFVHNCFVVLDVMHKWSLLVVKENACLRDEKRRKIHSMNQEKDLLLGDISAVDCVLKFLESCSQRSSSSPLMALLGEECNPIGFDIAVCTAGALLHDNHDIITSSWDPPSVAECSPSSEVQVVPATHAADEGCRGGGESSMGGGDVSVHVQQTRRPFVRDLDNYTDICDEVLALMIDNRKFAVACCAAGDAFDGYKQPFHSIPDMCGMTPLLGMCSQGLWRAAERATAACSELPLRQSADSQSMCTSMRATARGASNHAPILYFPGGLRAFMAANDSRVSPRHVGHIRALISEWNLNNVPFESEIAKKLCLDKYAQGGSRGGPIMAVDALDVTVLKRENKFAMHLLRQGMFLSRSTHELMVLAYVMNNIDLCLDIALDCENNNSNSAVQVSTLKHLSYFSFNDDRDDDRDYLSGWKRYRNSIGDFSIGHGVKHNAFGVESYVTKKMDGFSACPLQATSVAKCAARALIGLSQVTSKECQSLNQVHKIQAQSMMTHTTTSGLQKYQQLAMDQYGFIPVRSGPFAGMCFSNDGRVWVMDGSLMSTEEFFSDVKNLSKALPVPQTTLSSRDSPSDIHSNVCGYTIVSSIANNAAEMSDEVLDFIFLRFKNRRTGSRVAVQHPFLCTDVKKRSPVFIAVARRTTSLAKDMLAVAASTQDQAPSATSPVSVLDDGLSYHFLKTSSNRVSALEADLESRLQGSYRDNVSGVLMRLLVVHLDRVSMLWEYLQHKCEIGTMARLVYDPDGQLIDCFQRAKDILLLLNIPFSQLRQQLADKAEGSGTDDPTVVGRYHKLSPDRVKKLVSWKTAMDLKHIVQGWVQLRTSGGDSGTRESLQSIFDSKMKNVMKQQPNLSTSKASTSTPTDSFPFKKKSTEVESSVLLYHSLDLSLVTYGFASVQSANVEFIEGDKKDQRSQWLQQRESFWNSPFPPLLLAETRHLIDKKSSDVNGVRHMSQLFALYKKNTPAILKAMQCAYAILEFARTLSTTRILVSLTQEEPDEASSVPKVMTKLASTCSDDCGPSPRLPCLRKSSVKTPAVGREDVLVARRHPIDAIRQAIICARDSFNSTKAFVSSLAAHQCARIEVGKDQPEAVIIRRANVSIQQQFLSAGAASRVQLADNVGDWDLKEFLTLKPEVSPMFSHLRHVLLESLLIFLGSGDSGSDSNEDELQCLTAQLEHYLTYNSVYDEKALLEGRANRAQSRRLFPLTVKECAMLSKKLLAFMQNISINNITGVKVKLAQSRKNSSTCKDGGDDSCTEEVLTFTPVLSEQVIEKLFKHIQLHPTIFCHNASIPTRAESGCSYGSRPEEALVPLSQCPCQEEHADILNLIECRSNCESFGTKRGSNNENDANASNLVKSATTSGQSDSSARTAAALNAYIAALNRSYRVSETVIELILTAIGLHSMGHVYLLDVNNSTGGLQCSPYIGLCYVPLLEVSGASQLDRESDIISCFSLLQTCEVTLKHTHGSFSHHFSNCFSPTSSLDFSQLSELQYSMYGAAIFGKSCLFAKLLELENKCCSSEFLQYRASSCLVWYVLLVCPPASNTCADDDCRGDYKKYSSILVTMLKNGFGAVGPRGSQFSTLDLASLKQLPAVVQCLLETYRDTGSWQDCSLLRLGAFHFISMSKKFNASTLDLFLSLQEFDRDQAVSAGVSLEHFVPACINDSELFADMFDFMCGHIQFYRKLTRESWGCGSSSGAQGKPMLQVVSSLQDVLKCDNVDSRLWNVDISVHLLASSLKKILYSAHAASDCVFGTARVPHCPLHDLVSEVTTEVLATRDFTCKTELSTVVKALSWSNAHFVLSSQMTSKFETYFAHFFYIESNTTVDTSLSSTGLDSLQPLISLTESGYGQVCCDLLHYVCFYSMNEALQIMIDSVGNSSKELNLNASLFFGPLNNTMTPVDVALAVGATECVALLLHRAEERLSFHEANNALWKMLYSSLGRGLGGEEMCLVLCRVIFSVYSKHSTKRELRRMMNLPIENDLPRSGVVERETILHVGARRGYVRLCAALLEAGADAKACCSETGLSVISTSIACGHGDITQMLGRHCRAENNAVLRIAAMFRTRTLKRRRYGINR